MDKWVMPLRGERNGITPKASAMTPDQQRIKELEKKIRRIVAHNEILKKAIALAVNQKG